MLHSKHNIKYRLQGGLEPQGLLWRGLVAGGGSGTPCPVSHWGPGAPKPYILDPKS